MRYRLEIPRHLSDIGAMEVWDGRGSLKWKSVEEDPFLPLSEDAFDYRIFEATGKAEIVDNRLYLYEADKEPKAITKDAYERRAAFFSYLDTLPSWDRSEGCYFFFQYDYFEIPEYSGEKKSPSKTKGITLSSNVFKATRIGLELKGDFTKQQWENFGLILSDAHGGLQWMIGDWLNIGEKEFKYFLNHDAYSGSGARKRYNEVKTYIRELFPAIELKTLRNWKYVAKHVPLSLRRDALSWSHHAKAINWEDRGKWLDIAEQEGLSVRQMDQTRVDALWAERESRTQEEIEEDRRRWNEEYKRREEAQKKQAEESYQRFKLSPWYWEEVPEARDILADIREMGKILEQTKEAVRIGKFSPEGKKFVQDRLAELDKLIDETLKFCEDVEYPMVVTNN